VRASVGSLGNKKERPDKLRFPACPGSLAFCASALVGYSSMVPITELSFGYAARASAVIIFGIASAFTR
jgi:hypothetical protein